MHNLMIHGWNVNFNGDFSGDIYLEPPNSPDVMKVPFSLMAALVAEKVRRDRITALEQADDAELLK